jgi:polar amino acid transport system substrate-binding protein
MHLNPSVVQARQLWRAVLAVAVSMLLGLSLSASAQLPEVPPAPTLVPPTWVPASAAPADSPLPTESALARIRAEGNVRVGLLYNLPPFGELNPRGEVTGFDADLARSMAEAWGVEFEPVQVTRQTAIQALRSGAVDTLIAAQPQHRDLALEVEFSQTYFPSSQSVLVRGDDGAARPSDLANRRVGVVLGYPSERALAAWQGRTGIPLVIQTYYNLDQAFVALIANEVDAIVDDRVRLGRISQTAGQAKLLDEPIQAEPFAVAIRRQDVHFRNLINRTLQFLVQGGRMQEITQTWFPGARYPAALVTLWANLGTDAPRPDQFGTDLPYPAGYVIPRIQAERVVRVAGVVDLPPEAAESERRLDAANRRIIEALVARWGMRVQYIPNSRDNAADLVSSGQADLAVGVRLDWALADRVDFSSAYLLHGERLMVRATSDVENFSALLGRVVGVLASEPGSGERAVEIARSAGGAVRTFSILRDQDAALEMLVNTNVDVVFADSLKLIPLLEQNADLLRITTRGDAPSPWYSLVARAFAVTRNDLDFRLLVEYTLESMSQDGSLRELLNGVMLPGESPFIITTPGADEFMGISLTGAPVLAG